MRTRGVIGWCLSDGLDDSLILTALRRALEQRVARPRLVPYYGGGVQYASGDYTDLLQAKGIDIRMSRKGDPCDHAACESFIKTLKYARGIPNRISEFPPRPHSHGRVLGEGL